MPRAIHVATARDALTNDRRESTTRFEKPAKQVLALATEPRAKREARSVLVIPVSSPVATFEQSENVAIACYEGCGLCNRFHLRLRSV